MDKDELFDIAYDDHDDYDVITKPRIYEQTRWSVYKECVVKQNSTGKFFNVWWGEGATEYQDGQDEPCGMFEVEPIEVTRTEYAKIDDGLIYNFD